MKLNQHKVALNSTFVVVVVIFLLLFFFEENFVLGFWLKPCLVVSWNFFLELFIIDCGRKIFGKFLASRKVFSSMFSHKPSSYLHRGSRVTFYLFFFQEKRKTRRAIDLKKAADNKLEIYEQRFYIDLDLLVD